MLSRHMQWVPNSYCIMACGTIFSHLLIYYDNMDYTLSMRAQSIINFLGPHISSPIENNPLDGHVEKIHLSQDVWKM